jgi:asparagine synthase (glutamine-hydrolysing)
MLPSNPRELVPRDLIERAAGALAARGPDARFVGFHGTCAIAATRLAVVDRTPASDPPILDPSGQVALLYNGELYDADEHRRELTSRGHRLSSRGDGEVVLAAYLEWGVRFLREIDGMFALAIVDRREEAARRAPLPTIVLARDRFGEKPLLFTRTKVGIAFGSSATAIRPFLDEARPDLDALAAVLRHGFIPGGATGLVGVHRIRPGTALVLQEGSASIYPFAEKAIPEEAPEGGIEDWASELWDRIRAAVRRRSRSEVGLGLFLSGGLDSAAIARALVEEGIAARAFTAGFRGERDERPLAKNTAEALGLPWDSIELGPEILDRWESLTRAVGEPLADASVLNLAALAERARSHATVVLSGEGGDELFGGYRRERAFEMIGRVRVPRVVTGPLSRLRGEPGRIGRALSRAPGIGRYQELRDRVSEGEELLLPPFRRGDAVTEEGLPGEPTAPLSDLYSYLPNDLLFRLDAATMASSLEGRAPLLDPDLADFAASLPQKARHGVAVGKRVLRKALEGKIPDAVVRGRKVGFGAPLARWFRETGFAERVLLDPRSGEAPLDRSQLSRILAEHRLGKRDASLVLARAIAVELFRRGL